MKKENKEVTFCMDEFWAFGMATEIARITKYNTSKIDRYISSGKIKESRTMDKAIFELLGGIYGKLFTLDSFAFVR